MSGCRGVTFSLGHGRGRWLSLTQLASLPEMEGNESRDRYLYSRQLDRQRERERLLTHSGFIMLLVQLVSVVLSFQKWKTIPSRKVFPLTD